MVANISPSAVTPLLPFLASNADSAEPPPATLGRFVILNQLAEGGNGRIFQAYDPELQRRVAIKALKKFSPSRLKRFKREAQLLAGLYHPHILSLHEILISADHPNTTYLIMPLVDGPITSKLIQSLGKIPEHITCIIGHQIAKALQFSHKLGVIHGDVKPDNILLDPHTGRALLSDFGSAFYLEPNKTLSARKRPYGTANFMAPECFTHIPPAPPEDIFALGVTLFVLLTGRYPFDTQDDISFPDHVPVYLQKLISRCLHDIPAKRPNAASVAETLRSKLSDQVDDEAQLAAFLQGLPAPPAPPTIRQESETHPGSQHPRTILGGLLHRPAAKFLAACFLIAAMVAIPLALKQAHRIADDAVKPKPTITDIRSGETPLPSDLMDVSPTPESPLPSDLYP